MLLVVYNAPGKQFLIGGAESDDVEVAAFREALEEKNERFASTADE